MPKPLWCLIAVWWWLLVPPRALILFAHFHPPSQQWVSWERQRVDSFRNLCACDGNCVCTQISCGLVSETGECSLQVVLPQTLFLMLLLSPHWTPHIFSLFSQMYLIRGFHVVLGKASLTKIPLFLKALFEGFNTEDLSTGPQSWWS